MSLLQKRIASILAAKGMKASELTRLSGVNISRLLNSDSSPQLSTINRIAEALQIPAKWLTDPKAYPPSKNELDQFNLKLTEAQKIAGASKGDKYSDDKLVDSYLRDYDLDIPIVTWRSLLCKDPYLSDSREFLKCPYKASERSFCVRAGAYGIRPVFSTRDYLFIDPDNSPSRGEYVVVGEKVDPNAPIKEKEKLLNEPSDLPPFLSDLKKSELLRNYLNPKSIFSQQLNEMLVTLDEREKIYSTLHLFKCGMDGNGLFFAPIDIDSPIKSFYYDPDKQGIVGTVIGKYSDMRSGSFSL